MRARVMATGLVASVLVLGIAAVSAQALTPGWECIPTTAGQAVVSGGTGAAPSCGAGTTAVLAPTYISSGVGGKPTVQFSAVNVQIVNGTASEATTNGEGNLIVGYDEKGGAQTGSHNLELGGSNSYTSYGGLVGGLSNKISEAYASVLGGASNTAASYASTISGGYANKTSAYYTTVSGGCSNLAGTGSVTLNALCTNLASYPHAFASVTGGTGNQAGTTGATASGGESNLASGFSSSVSGGKENKATANESSILGGEGNTSSTACQAIPAAPVNALC